MNRRDRPSNNSPDDSLEWDVRYDEPLAADGARGWPGDFPDMAGLDEEESESALPFKVDLRRLIIGAWQRRYVALMTFAGVTTLLFSLILFGSSASWQAHTTLIKRTHQDRLTLAERDPFKTQEYTLATLLDTLKLPSSIRAVATEAGLDVSPTTLASAIDVSLNRDSTILNLKLTWNDPVMAAELANRVAAKFIERTSTLIRDDAAEGFEYYSGQLEDARREAQAASAEVLAFRQEYGISDLDTQTQVLLQDLSSLQGEYNARVAEAAALTQAKARIETAMESEPEQMIMYTTYRSPLKTRLADYEWQLQEALTKYTEENPKVIKLKESIETIESMIAASQDQDVPENTYTQNNKLFQMELRVQELTDEIQVKEAQAQAIATTLEEKQAMVDKLSTHEKEYLMLQSRLEGILTLETNLSRRVEETRLVMQRQDGIFDIVEAATPPTEPLPSGRKLLAVASLIFAGGGAIVLVLLLELIDPYVRSLRDVMDIFDAETGLEIARGRGRLMQVAAPMTGLANDFRRFCNDIDSNQETGPERLGLISLHEGDGRSSVTANLALTRAMKGQRCLLIDADLRPDAGSRPEQVLELGQSDAGLYEHLVHSTPLNTSEHLEGRLKLLGAGEVEDERGLIALGAADFGELLERLGAQRHVLVDLPPLEDLEVTLELAAHLDSVILVARAGQTLRSELKAAAARLGRRGIEIRAVLITGVDENRLASAPLISLPELDRFLPLRWRGEARHA